MDEPVLEVVEKTETTPERVIEKPASTPENLEKNAENPPKKKGGRPAGAKDKAPRRKTLKIVEEPIVKEPPKPEPAQPAPKAEPEPKAEPKPEAKPSNPTPEPMSPQSLLRESARHMLELKRLNDSARKSHLQSMYTRRLAVF